MAIILNDNLKINVGKPVDSKYLNGLAPYVNEAEANSVIPIGERYIGLTVNINNVEFWYKSGLDDIDLVEKFESFSGGTIVTDADNIGVGNGEIYSGKLSALSGDTIQLRTLVGSGSTSVSTVGSEVVIFSSGGTGGAPIYTGESPSNFVAGAVSIGTVLTGRTLSSIVEEMLVTTYDPTYVNPSNTFVDNQPNTQEVGKTIPTIEFTSGFDQGQILLQAVEQDKRSGLPNTYNYTGTGLPATQLSTSLTDIQLVNSFIILNGANTWSSSVSYDAGVQPLDSNNDPSGSPLPAGTTGTKTVTITGIYPWFYGKVGGGVRPTANQALIDSGTKIVASSSGNISVDYDAVGEWIWFAIPNTSTSKTKWEGSNSPSNTGTIGGIISAGGNLFPDPDVVSIDSPSVYWSGISYKIYVSNFATSTYDSGSPYTLTFKNS